MKTVERVILETVGISFQATDLTPMDYGECKKCMIAYASDRTQEVEAENTRLREALTGIKDFMYQNTPGTGSQDYNPWISIMNTIVRALSSVEDNKK
jgi:hypothetical protein